eukprot:IDg23685t1
MCEKQHASRGYLYGKAQVSAVIPRSRPRLDPKRRSTVKLVVLQLNGDGERVCCCVDPLMGSVSLAMEIAVEIEVPDTSLWVLFDTAAKSIWVDPTWFKERSVISYGKPEKAVAADVRCINASGRGFMSFRMWGDDFADDTLYVAEFSSNDKMPASSALSEGGGGGKNCDEEASANGLTVTNTYPKEDMLVILDWLGSKKIFSTFYIKDELYHVLLEPESRPMTAIRTTLGLLQYRRLPRGMKNAPGTLQRIVNMILGSRKGRDEMAFVDDTSVGTETEYEHLE